MATKPAGPFRSPVRAYACQPSARRLSWRDEVKHDGFRILAHKLGERAKIRSRRGADFTDRFPAIAEAVRGLSADQALNDGGGVAG
jgi:bifunctional non-homologous end joining protein LigD